MMCDTFGVIGKHKIFGKNSDRSPNEMQLVEYIEGYDTDEEKVKVTYIEIDQFKHINSILISRPSWMWGAEMGVNEYGVVIGNEAIFTKGRYKKKGLTGMDLVRLALERSKSAKGALEIIKDLIRQYGVGGNCGYDHKFYYDNSFLIMDRKKIYILETYKNNFSVQECKMGNISNCVLDAKTIKENKVVSRFSGSHTRYQLVNEQLHDDLTVRDAFNILRTHASDDYIDGSVKSVCMHAGKKIGDHTTNSMVVELLNNNINVYVTCGSMPCLSVYKKWIFGKKATYPIINDGQSDESYYRRMEKIKRKIMKYTISKNFYKKRDVLENLIIKGDISFSRSLLEEAKLYKKVLEDNKRKRVKYSKYWQKKNKIFEEESKC